MWGFEERGANDCCWQGYSDLEGARFMECIYKRSFCCVVCFSDVFIYLLDRFDAFQQRSYYRCIYDRRRQILPLRVGKGLG